MAETQPKFDARLKEGVAYFEEMLRVMPDDRTTLEFLSVAYPQLGESEKAEATLAALARALLKEGDLESASALLPRLESCELAEAKAMAVKIRAASAPRPDLSPEAASPSGAGGSLGGSIAAACASEAALAEDLDDATIAEHIRQLPDNGSPMLVSALATLAHEHPETCERAIAGLADKYGMPPVPLSAFDPDPALVSKLPAEIVRVRGVVPFAKLGATTLVAFLSPQDAALRRAVSGAFAPNQVRFFLADPLAVETALARLFPEEAK
jgi:hypothetical protein